MDKREKVRFMLPAMMFGQVDRKLTMLLISEIHERLTDKLWVKVCYNVQRKVKSTIKSF